LLGAFVLFWVFAALELWRGPIAASRLAFAVQGLLVLVPAWFSFVVLRCYDPGGRWFVLALLLVVWAADASAYFAGRAFGRHRLAPGISPGKSWEGFVAGLAGAALAGAVAGIWSPVGPAVLAPLAAVAALVSVVGDLVESRLKRAAGAKDSGRLIPGHGGLLDRIDSLTAAAPMFALGLGLLGVAR
jgi:phosphatidate cytidylyltransferase